MNLVYKTLYFLGAIIISILFTLSVDICNIYLFHAGIPNLWGQHSWSDLINVLSWDNWFRVNYITILVICICYSIPMILGTLLSKLTRGAKWNSILPIAIFCIDVTAMFICLFINHNFCGINEIINNMENETWYYIGATLTFASILICHVVIIATIIMNFTKKEQLRRDESKRYFNGENTFEFNTSFENMKNKLLYIENRYNETLNGFFKRHGCIEFKQNIRVIYLPAYMENLVDQDLMGYFAPWAKDAEKQTFSAQDVMQFIFNQLSYPENAKRLQHGILLFDIGFQYNKYGMEVYSAEYHHLEEGDDDYIMAQLTRIAESLYWDSRRAIYYHLDDNGPQEGVSDDYADSNFNTIYNNEIAILVKEVRERVIKLHQLGISEKLIMNMIKTPLTLSRLIITRDNHILLPEYGNIEIKMEPLNKAVYFLFLRHPEGIIFKHLPDYEQELLEIYAKLKPTGMDNRVRKSISDICNPCLNSINEKCARIRGAFISHFDESLAKNYYITGHRCYPKQITLPKNLVIWEK